MSQYFANLQLWWDGFDRFHEIDFKSEWGPEQFRWWLLYAVDYGTHVFAGGACVSWSRWAWENRKTNRLAAFLNRGLNHLDPRHGEDAGDALWGTEPCARPVRVGTTLLLLALLLLLLRGAWALAWLLLG